MTLFSLILIFTALGSVGSLIGSFILSLIHQERARAIAHALIPFAAGILLSTAFLDLLPEAAELGKETNIFFWTLGGILAFFLLERTLYWFHAHHLHSVPSDQEKKPTVALIVFGDTIHNFIDGIIIASAFLVSAPVGIITSLSVAAHEIPQELADFSLLLHRGISQRNAFLLNLGSSLSALVGAILTFLLAASVAPITPIILAATAGFFIYIALSDLIPEIHFHKQQSFAIKETIFLFFGVALLYMLIRYLE